MVAGLRGCLVVWLFGCFVVWLFGCFVVWLFGCLVVLAGKLVVLYILLFLAKQTQQVSYTSYDACKFIGQLQDDWLIG